MMPLPAPIAAYLDAYNARDVEAMLACLAPDVRFRNLTDGAVTAEADGLAAFAELARAGAAAFSSRRQSVTNAITVAETTLAEIAYEAVVAQDLPNGWRAGETITLTGASLFRLADGLIAEIVDAA